MPRNNSRTSLAIINRRLYRHVQLVREQLTSISITYVVITNLSNHTVHRGGKVPLCNCSQNSYNIQWSLQTKFREQLTSLVNGQLDI